MIVIFFISGNKVGKYGKKFCRKA